jgi:hypothetical protein
MKDNTYRVGTFNWMIMNYRVKNNFPNASGQQLTILLFSPRLVYNNNMKLVKYIIYFVHDSN